MKAPASGQSVALLLTQAHECSYWPGRRARTSLLDARAQAPATLYPHTLAAGFRRSGDTIYRPQCGTCNACVAVRIEVALFKPDRSQRRCRARNADLAVSVERTRVDAEVVDLYARYLEARHPGSPMQSDDAEVFREMMLAPWAETVMLVMRRGKRLIAVAITDVTALGCSAVYTFFDPDPQPGRRGLGTFAILRQIDLVREMGLPHLYLGYWIDTHPAMHYKRRFQPQQHFTPRGWQTAPTT